MHKIPERSTYLKRISHEEEASVGAIGIEWEVKIFDSAELGECIAGIAFRKFPVKAFAENFTAFLHCSATLFLLRRVGDLHNELVALLDLSAIQLGSLV